MKKILLSLIFVTSTIASFAQSGAQQFSGVFYRVQDTTAYQTAAVAKHSAGYADIYYNAQATNKHFDVWNGASYDHVFNFNGGSGGGGDTFSGDVTFVLPAGFTLGKYDNGDTAPWTGLTAVEALQDAAIAYINPTWNSFTYSGFATQVERGTTLSGSKTFTWSINANSGVVSTIDIYDVTAGSTLLAGTPNDGSQAQTISTVTLSSVGSTQSFRGVANNSSPSGTVNSSTITTTAYLYRWWGPVSSSLTNSASVRALSNSAFDTGGTSFTLNTGTTLIKFVVALPPGRTITSVIDLDALSANITSDFDLQASINVLDVNSVNAAYVIYEYNIAVPYGANHQLVVTYN